MKKLLDINIWLALSLRTHPHHPIAREWYENVPLRAGSLLFCQHTEAGLLRLLTQTAMMRSCSLEPFSNQAAATFLEDLYQDPSVGWVAQTSETRRIWLKLGGGPFPASNIWADAYLAAMAITLNLEFTTFDQGFQRYVKDGLRLVILKPAKI